VVQQAGNEHQGDDANHEQQGQNRLGGGLERWEAQAAEPSESRHQGGQSEDGE
jgi:hypothetical protein